MVPLNHPPSRRYAPVAVLAVTLLVFAVGVAYVGLWLRTGLRDQILRREADALTEVASLQLANEAEALAALGISEAPGELLNAVLKTSKLRGVFAVRVFDVQKQFSGALPLPWSDEPPQPEEWRQLIGGTPIVRLHTRESAAAVIGLVAPDARGQPREKLLETWLPLRRAEAGAVDGVAQMWIDGRAVSREFAVIDRRLVKQAALAWLAGAVIISLLLGWAFRQLDARNRELRARSEDLQRANRELTLAAKMSAIGAVTAHLMHELKNPVAGLEEFVANQAEGAARLDAGGELAAASELTRRLRTMINDVAAVMRDEQTGARYTLTGSEVVELVVAHSEPLARGKAVTLSGSGGCELPIDGRRANLARLVLQNLVQNAIEACASRGGKVQVSVEGAQRIHFQVSDDGPGLTEALQGRLFQPVPSTKRGGSGLGLALSQQLARQAGGRLELVETGPAGTRFQLSLDAGGET